MQIRTAVGSDIASMHRIRLAVRENRLSDPGRVSEKDYLPFVEAGSAWIATTDERTVGFAILDSTQASLWALFVDPDAERRGVGAALHERVLKWAHDHRLDRLSLVTTAGTRADQFYRRRGWIEVECSGDGEVRLEREL